MAQTSFALMTNLGRAKEAAALANATSINITHIAIGDGVTVPSGGEVSLYSEVDRKTISAHGTVVGAENTAYFDCFLAANDGPYSIREAGLIDSEGDLIAIAHYNPPISKPVPASGQTVEGTVRIEVAFSDIATVNIIVDPAMKVALQRLTRLPWIPINSMDITAPPAAPAVGDVYLIPSGATGSWAGHSGKIAEYTAAGWAIIAPPDGHGIGLPDGRLFERVSGAYVEKIALDVQAGKWLHAVAGGTANAITASVTPAPDALVDGMAVHLRVATANTGAVTLNLNGLGVKPIVRASGEPVAPGDLLVGATVVLSYHAASGAWRALPSLASDVARVAFSRQLNVNFTTPGTYDWVVPAGIYSVRAEGWGAGGGAGAGNGTHAPAGGGAGAYVSRVFEVVPGQVITVVVGAGGAGGTLDPDQRGQTGGATLISMAGTTIAALGGVGGVNHNGGFTGSAGGLPEGAYDEGLTGGAGGLPQRYTTQVGGNGGSAPNGGQGGIGGSGSAGAANAPGGGAGGRSAAGSGLPGAAGAVRLSYAKL